MSKIVAVANQKGGVGKTTTAVNFAASLALKGERVLLIDLDPQGNASSAFGIEKERLEAHSYQLLLDHATAEEAIVETEVEGLSLIPTNTDLAGAEVELVNELGREGRLAEQLEPLVEEERFDLILIDCPPSLGLITLNALTAADSLLIPLQCEFYALEGVSQLLRTLRLVQRRLNASLEIEGVLLTMFDRRNKLSFQIEEEVRSHFQELLFTTKIPRNVRLSESPSFGKPIALYAPRSTGARAYNALAEEWRDRQVEEVEEALAPEKSAPKKSAPVSQLVAPTNSWLRRNESEKPVRNSSAPASGESGSAPWPPQCWWPPRSR